MRRTSPRACSVPFARVGARLPDGTEIRAAELRKVANRPACCARPKSSSSPITWTGYWSSHADAPLGTPLAEYLHLDDAILEVNVTPNRGDCLSVLGIAREIAARDEAPLRPFQAAVPAATLRDSFAIELKAGPRCPRFVGKIVRGVNNRGSSPLWLRERLRRAGLRPIHPVVDVTNYVMLELGQPLHAYDLAKLEQRLEVRLATSGESIVLLDGRRVDLADDVLVIADVSGPVGLAGIMGGQATAVSPETTDILLEGAFFSPQAIAGRARRYALHTDASLRFERGVDPAQQQRAIERATELLLQICGGQAGPPIVAERKAAICLRARKLLFVASDSTPCSAWWFPMRGSNACSPVSRCASKGDAGDWLVTPPSFRFDVCIEEDLIEEVGRMVGYDAIPATPGAATERLAPTTETRIEPDRLADILVGRGYTEVITYSFVDPELDHAVNPGSAHVRLTNPIASDMAVLRSSLWPGLLQVARHNLSHQRSRVRVFELGPQFASEGGRVRESAVLAGLSLGARSPEHWDGGAKRRTISM